MSATNPRVPCREPLLAWVREHAPDLRILRALDDGVRCLGARFTYAGEVHELEARGDNADEDIALKCAGRLRELMMLPPLESDRGTRVDLEQQIVAAHLAGRTEEAEAITRQMLFAEPRRARPATLLGTKTQISTRKP